MDNEKARIRNLIFKIANWNISTGGDIRKNFSKETAIKELFFKRADIENFYDIIFEDNKIKEQYIKEINSYLEKRNDNLREQDEELRKVYNSLSELFNSFSNNREKISIELKKAIKIASKLHWKYLPIYLEQYIVNNGYNPETETEQFYNHFHAIEDLYRYIFTSNKITWNDNGGDSNLGIDFKFKIYTVRWGHYDTYTINRTINGWYLSGLPAGTGICDKDGVGAITNALEHDQVCYPVEGVKDAFRTLWDDADKNNINIEELQNRLDDISKWIKEIEIKTREYQPKWCGFYYNP